MKQPRNNQPSSSNSNKTLVTLILVLMGFGVLLLITLVAFAFRGSFPSLTFLSPATQTQPFPTLFFPTPDCGSPTLLIGSTTFQIQNASLSPYGTVKVPPDTNGVAYHVEGAGLPFAFILSPTQENIAFITSLRAGTTAKATSTKCNSITFTLSAPQPGTFSPNPLPDQSIDSLVLFVQTDATGNGLAISGGMTEEEISTFNTPDASHGVQAEIGLLETTSDVNNIQIKVSIYNFGTTPITLTSNDISLTQTDGVVQAPGKSSQRLPETIKPAETKEFTFTFSRPATPTATLKIFTVEYDVGGY